MLLRPVLPRRLLLRLVLPRRLLLGCRGLLMRRCLWPRLRLGRLVRLLLGWWSQRLGWRLVRLQYRELPLHLRGLLAGLQLWNRLLAWVPLGDRLRAGLVLGCGLLAQLLWLRAGQLQGWLFAGGGLLPSGLELLGLLPFQEGAVLVLRGSDCVLGGVGDSKAAGAEDGSEVGGGALTHGLQVREAPVDLSGELLADRLLLVCGDELGQVRVVEQYVGRRTRLRPRGLAGHPAQHLVAGEICLGADLVGKRTRGRFVRGV